MTVPFFHISLYLYKRKITPILSIGVVDCYKFYGVQIANHIAVFGAVVKHNITHSNRPELTASGGEPVCTNQKFNVHIFPDIVAHNLLNRALVGVVANARRHRKTVIPRGAAARI